MPTPKPVPASTICSECGLPWQGHKDKPTLETCVRLLKAELARRPKTSTVVWPYATPYWAPSVTISTSTTLTRTRTFPYRVTVTN